MTVKKAENNNSVIDEKLPLLEQTDLVIKNYEIAGASLLRIFKALLANFKNKPNANELCAFVKKLYVAELDAESRRASLFLTERLGFRKKQNQFHDLFWVHHEKEYNKLKDEIDAFNKEKFNHLKRINCNPSTATVAPTKPRRQSVKPSQEPQKKPEQTTPEPPKSAANAATNNVVSIPKFKAGETFRHWIEVARNEKLDFSEIEKEFHDQLNFVRDAETAAANAVKALQVGNV